MKRTRPSLPITAFALLAASPVFGQHTGAAASDLSQTAGELRLPTFVRAPLGPTAVVLDVNDEAAGYVKDHVFDPTTGQVVFVAVASVTEVAEPARLVPFDRFAWSDETKRLVLLADSVELAAMPEYDLATLPAPERRAALADESEGAAAGEVDTLEASMPRERAPYVATSSLLGCRVLAGEDSFATARELVIEPRRGRILFVLAKDITLAGDSYVLPWEALSWERPSDTEEAGRLLVETSEFDPDTCPRLRAEDLARLQDPETLVDLFEHFGLTPPLPTAVEAHTGS